MFKVKPIGVLAVPIVRFTRILKLNPRWDITLKRKFRFNFGASKPPTQIVEEVMIDNVQAL